MYLWNITVLASNVQKIIDLIGHNYIWNTNILQYDGCVQVLCNESIAEAGEMAQQLSILTVLGEDPGSISNIHMVAHQYL